MYRAPIWCGFSPYRSVGASPQAWSVAGSSGVSAIRRRRVEPAHDLGVVGGGVGEALRASDRRRPALSAPGPELVEHGAVVGGVDEDADVRMVLRRGADHRRPADVDQLDGRLRVERVEVGDDQVDRRDLVRRKVGLVLGIVTIGEDAAVHLRVQGHDPVAEHRRIAGEVGNVGHGHTGGSDRLRRSPRRDELDPQAVQGFGELDDAGLVVDAQQSSHGVPLGDGGTSPALRPFNRWGVSITMRIVST